LSNFRPIKESAAAPETARGNSYMATSTQLKKRSKKNRFSPVAGPGGPWSDDAPRSLRKKYVGPTNHEGWTLLRKHLAKRKRPSLEKLIKGRRSPLFWAVPQAADAEQAQRLVDLLKRPRIAGRKTAGLDNAVVCWLSRAEVAPADVGFGLECLAWTGALVSLAEHLDEPTWWQLCNRLFAIASDQRPCDDPLAVALLHGELPAALAYLLPELAAAESLLAVSRRTAEDSVRAAGKQGGLDGRRLDAARPTLACWTRWRLISQQFDNALWSSAAERRYGKLVEYVLRLSRPDGRQVFSDADSPALHRRLAKTALLLADRGKNRRLVRLLARGDHAGRSPKGRSARPSLDVESAGIALLKPDWSPKSPLLAVNYSGPKILTELNLGADRLFSGAIEVEVLVDGRPAVGRQHWKQVSWESDAEIDYLEIELTLSDDITIQRHIALAREDGFLLLADAVLGITPKKIQYRSTLPLADGVTFDPETETREGTLAYRGKPRARVLPLALPEWRSGPSCGTLESKDGALVLSQTTSAQSLMAPLFVDLDRRRLKHQLTWRQLTVAEDRQIVPPDVASGYRVQIGKAQWLLYRSLSDVGIRTVLGKNLMHEFLLGRFRSSGKIKTLMEIEG
jgi:hypothetical protein